MADLDPRIVAVELDERTVIWRNADVEQERRVAIFDLLEGNMFRPLEVEGGGPWRLVLRVEDGRLAIDLTQEGGSAGGTILLGLAPFRRVVREYFAICDSYYKAIRNASPSAIETIDMARRGIHNGAAELLMERLDGRVEMDFDTARRLFTLICVLHIRQ
ncbi:UPF0262 family protein [Sandaracinobacter sp. RS1-74]|uniref:UPF0262 family protein n=1 Tax=Sandaracinobacteroides sayramensis TaxID=2913411 RepID=UPI001EDBB241|nr:UPF0262 family protein [Sandaracinobacteroides sayramensis]MCG2839774.1 UPF0262 family protein [Sandaracinobacteroides sayramensis]